MHHALEIPEILLNIFYYAFHPPSLHGPWQITSQYNPDLTALARTCRTFREPALDILWSVLKDMSPVVRCLPDASCQSSHCRRTHKFSRALTQAEWDILRSYTRRIRTILYFDFGFDWTISPREMAHSSAGVEDSLFPNLRFLTCGFAHGTPFSPLHQPTPSLTALHITPHAANESCLTRDYVKPFFDLYPNLTEITLYRHPANSASNNDRGLFTWPWKSLQALNCPGFHLDAEDIRRLSCLPALTELTFALSHTDTDAAFSSSTPLVFVGLQRLKISRSSTSSLGLISRLLAQTQLPAITDLDIYALDHPPKSVNQFLAAVEVACVNRSITHLQLRHPCDLTAVLGRASRPTLTHEDLQAIMKFNKICHIDLQTALHVDLSDDALLELASAWPRLEFLSINQESGWNSPGSTFGGITPSGLYQLLLKCPSLNHLALAIDTRGYTTDSAAQLPAISKPNPSRSFHIDVIDSIVEEETVSAMAIFLSRIMNPYDNIKFVAWCAWSCDLFSQQTRTTYQVRWGNIYNFGRITLGRDIDEEDLCWGATRERYVIGV